MMQRQLLIALIDLLRLPEGYKTAVHTTQAVTELIKGHTVHAKCEAHTCSTRSRARDHSWIGVDLTCILMVKTWCYIHIPY